MNTGTKIGLGVALLYAISPKKSQKKIFVLPPIDNAPILSDGLTIAGIEITRNSTPNFNTWNRVQWAAKYKDAYQNDTPENAANLVWSQWNVQGNDNKDKFKYKAEFIINLATFKNTNSIGTVPTIDADSLPIYDTWYNWWNNNEVWTCQIWQLWFDLNNQKYGLQSAQNKFVNAWNKSDNWGGYGNLGMGNKCGMDCDFVNYFRLKGLDVATFGTVTTCTLISVPSNLLDAASATTKGIKDTANVFSSLFPIGAAIVVGAYLIKQSKK